MSPRSHRVLRTYVIALHLITTLLILFVIFVIFIVIRLHMQCFPPSQLHSLCIHTGARRACEAGDGAGECAARVRPRHQPRGLRGHSQLQHDGGGL